MEMNRDLTAATAGTATHDIAHSLIGKIPFKIPPPRPIPAA